MHHQKALVVLEGVLCVFGDRIVDLVRRNVLQVGLVATLAGGEIIASLLLRRSGLDSFQLHFMRDDGHAGHCFWFQLLRNVSKDLVVRVNLLWSNLVDAPTLSCSVFDFINKSPFFDRNLPLLLGIAVPYLRPYLVWPRGLLDLR